MKSVIIKIGVAVLLGAAFCIAVACLLCWFVGVADCKKAIAEHPPWMLLSAIAAVPGVVLTWYWRHMTNISKNENDEQRLITERFAKATEMLGSDKMEQRLGAIYQLERIAKDSPRDHWTVMETLCAYVRERSPWTEEKQQWADKLKTLDMKERLKSIIAIKPATDIQAAITVIGRRKHWGQETVVQRIHLKGGDLRGMDMREGIFSMGRLNEAHIEGAKLMQAHLEETDLYGAHLEGANLDRAHLERARLCESHLEGADLSQAHLEGADLSQAHLEGANLKSANLKDASLLFARYSKRKTTFPKTIATHSTEFFNPKKHGMINVDELDVEKNDDEDAA